MIIIQVKDPKDPVKRIFSVNLRAKLKRLRDNCLQDDGYYTTPTWRKSTVQPRLPVRAALNEVALGKAQNMPPENSIPPETQMRHCRIHSNDSRDKDDA
jgi:hypothetical protein